MVFHAEQFGLREFVFQLVHHVRIVDAIVVVGDHRLRLRAVQIVEVGFCRFLRAVGFNVFIHPRHRELGQNIGFRDNDLKALRFVLLANVIHFRFKADQHVAQPAFGEGGGSTPTAGIKHFDVFQKLGHKLFGFRFIVTVRFVRCTPRGQIGITRVTGGFRIREDQLDVRTHQVVPVVDVFRVALAHQEAHGGIERRAVVRQAALPVRRDQLAFVVQDLHVSHLVVGHHIRFQPLQNSQRLFG